MLEETSVIHAMEQIDADGTVHYFGEDGREELVLSAEEAAAYQQQQIAAHDRAVCQSTTLVDVSTMPFIPNSVTELAVDADGHLRNLHLETRIWSCCTRRTRPALTCGRAIR